VKNTTLCAPNVFLH